MYFFRAKKNQKKTKNKTEPLGSLPSHILTLTKMEKKAPDVWPNGYASGLQMQRVQWTPTTSETDTKNE